jgi:hypothetical protein
MFGQGVFVEGVVDFVDGVAGVLGVAEVVGVELVEVELGAAAAAAMPTTEPPTASAPATIVALSLFEMCIGIRSPVLLVRSAGGHYLLRPLSADARRV